jgi:hypothetical protein
LRTRAARRVCVSLFCRDPIGVFCWSLSVAHGCGGGGRIVSTNRCVHYPS